MNAANIYVIYELSGDFYFTTVKNWHGWNRDPEQIYRAHGCDTVDEIKELIRDMFNVDFENIAVIRYFGNM